MRASHPADGGIDSGDATADSTYGFDLDGNAVAGLEPHIIPHSYPSEEVSLSLSLCCSRCPECVKLRAESILDGAHA